MKAHRRALVTGGSAGLGHAFCALLAHKGFDVHVVDRDRPAPCPPVAFHPCDLAEKAEVASIAGALIAHGPFDLVVHCAGTSGVSPFERSEAAEAERILAVNLRAPILLTRDLLAGGALAPDGRLIFVASLSCRLGYPGASVYAASKDGLVAFARSIRRPFRRERSVRVQVLLPGPMRTDHAERYAPPGSAGRGRADPMAVARLALRARRRATILPGWQAFGMAWFGALFPRTATRFMRRMIYAKLPGATVGANTSE